jgi:hypothetical protein
VNWRGRPVTSHQVIVQTMAATTRAGLRVHAGPGTSACQTGVRSSDGQRDALPPTRHNWHGE